MIADNTAIDQDSGPEQPQPQILEKKYKIQFRPDTHVFIGRSQLLDLKKDDLVVVHTDHGLEPCRILGIPAQIETGVPQEDKAADNARFSTESGGKQHHGKGDRHYEHPRHGYHVLRRANQEEQGRYDRLVEREAEAFGLCQGMIANHKLRMKLIRVERFFNGSKIIFYFTAEKRVDFRRLVKELVQEFRTRVEMRQIGVRHETKMLGGLGCCGRELCCSSFIREFAPVSIKMAKEQDLPLNPAKISGICNRLLCCLTYEFPLYREMKRVMPQPGRLITIEGRNCKVLYRNIIKETITIADPDDPGQNKILERKEWQNAGRPPRKPQTHHKKKSSSARKSKLKSRHSKSKKR
jgi:cell fate regulator YaaT (PSP1 superfamily)